MLDIRKQTRQIYLSLVYLSDAEYFLNTRTTTLTIAPDTHINADTTFIVWLLEEFQPVRTVISFISTEY